MTEQPKRAGTYIRQPSGYMAFIPHKLPLPDPLRYDDRLLFVLSKADQAMGKLNASADLVPNPDLFVGMYVRKEAVLSSQIEGVTQASLSEVVEQEVRHRKGSVPPDIAEVLNYVEALNFGMERLKTLPLSNRLIREIHALLMKGVRGGDKTPGEFRRTQNWIGTPGSDIRTAAFIPPPPAEMMDALADLERFLHEESLLPSLVKAGLAHYQFETIHPFMDGNGRMGRLLVAFLLCHQGVLKRPLLYLSEFINAHKEQYYDRLQAVRDKGDIEEWLIFFLTAVWRVAEAAAETASNLLRMREGHRASIQSRGPASSYGLQLLDHLLVSPFTTVSETAEILGVSYPTANSTITLLASLGILEEITGQQRNRLYRYYPYLALMEAGLAVQQSDAAAGEGLTTISS